MMSTTAVQMSHRIDPAQISITVGTGNGSHGRTMTVSSQTGASEAPARARPTTAAPASKRGGNSEGREREQPDAGAVKAADRERALRQPRGDCRQ